MHNYVLFDICIVDFIIQKLKKTTTHNFLKKNTNRAKLSSIVLTEREETKTRYFAPYHALQFLSFDSIHLESLEIKKKLITVSSSNSGTIFSPLKDILFINLFSFCESNWQELARKTVEVVVFLIMRQYRLGTQKAAKV